MRPDLPPSGLLGRRSECEALDGLVEAVRGGTSRVLVLRGDAGIGKSALLEHLVASASAGCRVLRAAGVPRAAGGESEMELPCAGMQALCAPTLCRVGRGPGPQRDALRAALGLDGGP